MLPPWYNIVFTLCQLLQVKEWNIQSPQWLKKLYIKSFKPLSIENTTEYLCRLTTSLLRKLCYTGTLMSDNNLFIPTKMMLKTTFSVSQGKISTTKIALNGFYTYSYIHILWYINEKKFQTPFSLNINNCKHTIHIPVLVIILVITFIILPILKHAIGIEKNDKISLNFRLI